MIRFQPSTSTNSRSLKGSDIMTGGSIIIPIERSMLATTISIIRKGMKIRNPISKAVFNSLIAKAGTTTLSGRSAGFAGTASFESFRKSAMSFSRVCLSIKAFTGFSARFSASPILICFSM
jgi:hypothetical protein